MDDDKKYIGCVSDQLFNFTFKDGEDTDASIEKSIEALFGVFQDDSIENL